MFTFRCEMLVTKIFLFADDLSSYKGYDGNVSNSFIRRWSKQCQANVHAWGAAKQLSFEPSKESMSIMSNHDPEGPSFKLMGIMFDTMLPMKEAVTEVCSALRWKLTTLLRTRRMFDTPTMVIQFKVRLLSYVEHRTAATYHADSTVIDPIDRQYERFLSAIGLTKSITLQTYFLAPLNARRDMAVLGVIHRAVLGKCPKQIQEFFAFDAAAAHPVGRSTLRRQDN